MKIWILLFICMMSMPLVVALLYFRLKKGQILKIRQNYVKDTRYFGRSFANMMEKALPEMKNNVITLSKPEEVLEIEEDTTFKNSDIEKLVLSRKQTFCLKQEGLEFHKEIYCEKDAMFLAKETKIRAVYSKQRILFGNNIHLLRWADAEEAVVVYDGCDLGRRVSSGEQLVIGFDNTFQSLYAPMIRLGQRPQEPERFMESRDMKIFRMPVLNSHEFNRHYIHEDMITENGTVPYSIISRGDVKVIENIILQGDIHSDESVRIMENAAVLGNIFAEKDVLLEKNATVLGNVFTQGNIIFEEGASVGQPNKISSVVARGNISFYGNNYVFGYITSEGGGEILKADESLPEEYCFPEKPVYTEKLVFQSLEEYQNVDYQGFRMDQHIKEAVIPDGSVVIPASQFFKCQKLEKICLPKSISIIEDYAFADCTLLQMQEDLSQLPLNYIGNSAFENCEKLEVSRLPDSLETIEGAAFAGCLAIEKIIFSDNALLKKIGAHSFRGCKKLKEVYLPDQIEYIGISAFKYCSSLVSISVPERIKDQPGIAELNEICPKVQIHFREVKEREKE